jgi:hypothetical protein
MPETNLLYFLKFILAFTQRRNSVNTKKLLLLTLLISGVMVLVACAPATTPETAPEDPPQPEPTEPVAYPYPDPGTEQADQPEAYPAPDEAAGDKAADPYPGVEDDIRTDSEELVLTDFTILPSDKALQPGPVYIEEASIVMKESYPVQVELVLTGNLPTPCHKLRVFTSEPDEDGHILVEAYTVTDPDRMCAQVLKPFTASVPLGDFTEGTFTFSVNDGFEGEFQLP